MSIGRLMILFREWSDNPLLKNEDVSDYSVWKADAAKLRALYEVRYDTYKSARGRNDAYEMLLADLTNDTTVTAHTLVLEGGAYLIITDDSISRIIGVLGGIHSPALPTGKK